MPRHFEISSLPNLRAVITSKWDRRYTSKIVRQVESFYVDSSLDNDADSWQVTIGDPTGEYLAMMNRDNEVRIQLLSSEPGAVGHILTGIADDLTYDQEGLFTVTGRDYAALALDSTCEPGKWKKVKPQYVIATQAKKLGFPASSLNDISKWKKVIKTDGSETYWEFWFRLVRNDKAYMWVGPNGTLILNKLAYSDSATYWFGTPQKSDSIAVQRAHMPVEGIEIRKSVQGRVHTVWVYAHNGKFQIAKSVTDKTIDGWVRRPIKIIQDTISHTEKGVKKTAYNEIYEGKVGSLEIRLVVSNPNFMISANRMCRIRIPEIELFGMYFIVGTRMQAGPDGFVQEIRLREKNLALSRRVPQEPKIPQLVKKAPNLGTPDHQPGVAGSEDPIDTKFLSGLIPGDDHDAWSDFFYKAASNNHGDWDFDIFLCMILAIAFKETAFHNWREVGMNIGRDKVEWWPNFPGGGRTTVKQAVDEGFRGWTKGVGNRDEYELAFANEKGTHGLNKEADVGVMQLPSREWKHAADDFYSDYAKGGGAGAGDMAKRIDTYLTKKLSPLAGYGSTFVSSGAKSNVDPRLMPAIAGGETSFGTDPDAAADVANFNAWGYGPHRVFTSWTDSINYITDVIGTKNYYIADGNTSVKKIGVHWAPTDAENDPLHLNANWVGNVSGFMTDLGGDPENVVYPPGVKDKLPDHGHDQYFGGRWDPDANINTGAKFFKECLDATHLDPSNSDQVDAMAYAYTRYATGSLVRDSPLITQMKKIMNTDPGFLTTAKEAVAAVKQAALDADDDYTDGRLVSGSGEPGDPTVDEASAAFKDWDDAGAASSEIVTVPSPGVAGNLPPIRFLQSKNFVAGRKHPIIWIVIHTMEIDETDHTAEDLAGTYATGKNEVAVHYCIDNTSVIQCVRDADTGRGILVTDTGHPAGATGNEISISVEHAGWAANSAATWADDYHQSMLKMSAKLVGVRCKQYGLQRKRLSIAEINGGQSGIVSHGDIYSAYTEGDVRTDPGPNFPWTQYIGWVKDAAGDP
jgi:hypothetical protein